GHSYRRLKQDPTVESVSILVAIRSSNIAGLAQFKNKVAEQAGCGYNPVRIRVQNRVQTIARRYSA
ncbi:MAG: hypothetical protein KAV87_51035, partial [Desulfobacteraceae bacterium]|nr:hypothetical protein [Desulfobacteraceae bacterium]